MQTNNMLVKNNSQNLHSCVDRFTHVYNDRFTHVYNAQESHRSYTNNLKQGSNLGANTPLHSIHKLCSILCNYCCKQGHTSVECWFRRKNNMSNVV